MKALIVALLSFLFVLNQFAHAEERSVDFTVSPGVILDGTIQVSYEWLSPSEFQKKDLSILDLPRLRDLHPGNNHMVASKIAFIARKSFEQLSYAHMNTAAYISSMLNSVAIRQKSADTYYVTNKVRAYSIPFKVGFDFKFKEVSSSALGSSITQYLRDEASGLKGTGKERFLTLDMTNFSQLMYRNYSIVYMKEISANETLIVSGVIAALDLDMANTFFNIPPFSTTKSTMMENMRGQIGHMARKIQK